MNITININDLPQLEDVTDSIIPLEEKILDEKDALHLLESCLQIMEEYIHNYPKAISEPDFEDVFKESIEELLYIQFEDELKRSQLLEWNHLLEEDIDMIIEEAWEILFHSFIPYRSYPSTIILTKPNIEHIEKHLQFVRSIPQPVQRTKEWYELRHNLITASNAYKCFESQSMQNQIIFEKCQPLKVFEDLNLDADLNINTNTNDTKSTFVNTNTTLHWGQKYEPVSILLYEYLYGTTIEDFGCIPHINPKYSFLGASPDGIVVNKESDRFGRMLEIKNIVNREITGIPKKEYWIQMQLQMEVWDLNECDFLETRFSEYETYSDYCNDTTIPDDKKGVIMYFSSEAGVPLYIYKPIGMSNEEEIEKWEEEMRLQHETSNQIWIKNIYWKLEEMSCVLVLRNSIWFQQNIGEIERVWNIILEERKTGYDHRSPNKRVKIDLETDKSKSQMKCLIKLNK